ncbi:unnamed protein product [Diabrotica balteata]|uniref:Uncharacterized protein n=1 Tax=Diabrotica balteata TaxID=107213 RepID=A0A9P0DVL7_DIABA|nr:unnamed protein product [Diabrotica balteata]
MKVLAVIIVVLSLTAAEYTLDEMATAFRGCGAEYGGPNDIRKLVVAPDADIVTLSPMCLCIDVKLGVTNENGDINKHALREIVMLLTGNKSTADKVDERCTERNGETALIASFNLWRCARLIIDNENN